MILIGIDIGAGYNSAIAVYETKSKTFLDIFSGTVFEVLEILVYWDRKTDSHMCVVVEDNTLERGVFNQWEPFLSVVSAYFKKGIGSIQSVKAAFDKCLQMAQAVGKNKYICKLFIAEIKMREMPHLRVSPSSRDRADKSKFRGGVTIEAGQVELMRMPTKTTEAEFKRLTGYMGNTNEHERDAATLVWNKTVTKLMSIAKKHHNISQII